MRIACVCDIIFDMARRYEKTSVNGSPIETGVDLANFDLLPEIRALQEQLGCDTCPALLALIHRNGELDLSVHGAIFDTASLTRGELKVKCEILRSPFVLLEPKNCQK